MKSILKLTLVALCISISSSAQNAPSTLIVAGKSRMMITPEVAKISVGLTSVNKDYAVCMDSLKSQSESLRRFLLSHGVEASSIKSNRFHIGETYVYESGKRKKNGFEASQSVVVQVINDIEKVNRIVDAIGKSKTKGEVNVEFELSEANRTKVKSELIANAIKDANGKAEIIVKNSKVTLGKLLTIEYGAEKKFSEKFEGLQNSLHFMPPMIRKDEEVSVNTLSISPEEIEMTDEIVMEWEIVR